MYMYEELYFVLDCWPICSHMQLGSELVHPIWHGMEVHQTTP